GGTGISPTVTVASRSGDMVVDALAYGCMVTVTSNQNLGWVNGQACNTAGGNSGMSTAPGGTSVTMGYTVPSDWWGLMAIDIVAAGNSTAPFGFTGAVTLSVAGLPAGATGTFSPNPATASSTLTVTTAAGTPLGNSTLTITGGSGTLTHTANVTLTVWSGMTVTAPNTNVSWKA